MAQVNQNLSFAGLGTLTMLAPQAGLMFLDGKLNLPRLASGDSADSSCLVTVNLNSSPVYVGSAGDDGFKTEILVAANDQIDVVLSSSNAVDQGLNVIKMNLAVGQGV